MRNHHPIHRGTDPLAINNITFAQAPTMGGGTTTTITTNTKTKTPSSAGDHAVFPAIPNSQCPSYRAEDEPAKYPPEEPNGGTHQEWAIREW